MWLKYKFCRKVVSSLLLARPRLVLIDGICIVVFFVNHNRTIFLDLHFCPLFIFFSETAFLYTKYDDIVRFTHYFVLKNSTILTFLVLFKTILIIHNTFCICRSEFSLIMGRWHTIKISRTARLAVLKVSTFLWYFSLFNYTHDKHYISSFP